MISKITQCVLTAVVFVGVFACARKPVKLSVPEPYRNFRVLASGTEKPKPLAVSANAKRGFTTPCALERVAPRMGLVQGQEAVLRFRFRPMVAGTYRVAWSVSDPELALEDPLRGITEPFFADGATEGEAFATVRLMRSGGRALARLVPEKTESTPRESALCTLELGQLPEVLRQKSPPAKRIDARTLPAL